MANNSRVQPSPHRLQRASLLSKRRSLLSGRHTSDPAGQRQSSGPPHMTPVQHQQCCMQMFVLFKTSQGAQARCRLVPSGFPCSECMSHTISPPQHHTASSGREATAASPSPRHEHSSLSHIASSCLDDLVGTVPESITMVACTGSPCCCPTCQGSWRCQQHHQQCG